MDKETKLVFGKILGEIYRIQNKMDNASYLVGSETIYGLLNGFEETLDQEIGNLSFISSEEVAYVSSVLNEYHINEQRLSTFNGYYNIEHKLLSRGIDRIKAKRIVTMFKIEGRFQNVIDKMDTSGSPGECRTFEIPEYEK